MNIELKNYPKSSIKLKEFVKEMLENFQKLALGAIPQGQEYEIPKIEDGILEPMMESLVNNQKRMLYDFMDLNEIYINTEYYDSTGDFGWNIQFNEKVESSKKEHNTRIEAENEGFIECFKILEENL